MTDSDIMINVSFSNDAQKRGPQAGKPKKRNVWFRRKMQYLERKGCLEGKYTHNHKMGQSRCDRAPPRHNGAATKHPSHPTATPDKGLPPGSSTSTPSSPAHSLPSSSVSVNKSSTHTSARIPTKYVAMDCEMVGSGPKGHISQLARCSIVSYHGDVVYDKFIKPAMPVTDYRTRWSGIQKKDLVNATPFSVAKKEVVKLLMGKVVVGHAVHNDFKVLGYSHPAALTRDTSRIPLLNRKAGFAERECASLKRLTKAIFNRDIQVGKKGHSSVEDAKATMELYKVVEEEWERHLAS